MGTDLGALVSDAIGAAAKKLRSFLNDDYGRYASTLHALDVVDGQLRALPLDQYYVVDRARLRGGRRGVDGVVGGSVVLDGVVGGSVVLDGVEWMLRLDQATNALEDLLQDMEEAVAEAAARAPPRWWRRAAPDDAVARWLGSDDKNMIRMELTVGRLASVYLEGGALFDVPSAGESSDPQAALESKDDDIRCFGI